MGANLLVELIAPRRLLLQAGSIDSWSDPKGEFLDIEQGGFTGFSGKQALAWMCGQRRNGRSFRCNMHDGGRGAFQHGVLAGTNNNIKRLTGQANKCRRVRTRT